MRPRVEEPQAAAARPGDRGIGKTILDDLKRKDIKRTVSRDLRELYYFYLDEESREKLRGMGRLRRWFLRIWWLFKSLVLNLSPARRLMLVVCLWFGLQGGVRYTIGGGYIEVNLRAAGFILLLVILMLELKDKLLARSELEVGRKVQLALLPDRNPELPGWDLVLFTRPANEVGGDLVDYHHLRDDRLALALGDVSGKGLGAALLMAKLQATLWAIAEDFGSLSDLGARANEILYRDGVSGRFATLVYMEVLPNAGLLRILNAGHPPPLVLRGHKVEALPPVAPPLGVVPEAAYTEQRVELGKNDVLLVYSDGLTEATNSSGEFFGEERLTAFLPQLGGLSSEEICKRLLWAVQAFMGDEPYSDDLSLAVLRRR